jgi:hypothetical protein
MNESHARSGAHMAAEEIFPMPLLPRLLGARAAIKAVEAKRRSAERIIDSHCIDRGVAVKALHALEAEAMRLALGGRNVPTDLLEAIATLERALGTK